VDSFVDEGGTLTTPPGGTRTAEDGEVAVAAAEAVDDEKDANFVRDEMAEDTDEISLEGDGIFEGFGGSPETFHKSLFHNCHCH